MSSDLARWPEIFWKITFQARSSLDVIGGGPGFALSDCRLMTSLCSGNRDWAWSYVARFLAQRTVNVGQGNDWNGTPAKLTLRRWAEVQVGLCCPAGISVAILNGPLAMAKNSEAMQDINLNSILYKPNIYPNFIAQHVPPATLQGLGSHLLWGLLYRTSREMVGSEQVSDAGCVSGRRSLWL